MTKTYVPKYQRLEVTRNGNLVVFHHQGEGITVTDRVFDIFFKPFEPASESVANSHGQPKC